MYIAELKVDYKSASVSTSRYPNKKRIVQRLECVRKTFKGTVQRDLRGVKSGIN